MPKNSKAPIVVDKIPTENTLFLSAPLSIQKRNTPSANPIEIIGKSRLAVWVIKSAVL